MKGILDNAITLWLAINQHGNFIRIWELSRTDYFWECGLADGTAFDSDGSDSFNDARVAAIEALGKDAAGVCVFVVQKSTKEAISEHRN